MLQMKDLDDDGFELEFDDDITKEAKEYYVRAYPNVNMIADRRVHCTSCDGHIGTAPASEKIIRMHPILRVLHCNQCDQFYKAGEFEKGADGSELYCRWCGQGGDVFCCSKCAYVFCKNCILRNFSPATLRSIKNSRHWNCFACTSESILPLQALYWALKNFFAKQKQMIQRQATAGRCYVEIENAMNHDSSTCCPNLYRADEDELTDMSGCSSDSDREEVRPIEAVRVRGKGKEKLARNRKRRRIVSSESSSDEAARAKKLPPTLSRKLSDDNSDSIELISDTRAARTPDTTTAAPQIRIASVRSENPAQQEAIPAADATTYTHTFLVSVTTSSGDPIYHTINGHRIELNAAAQQNSIRLSDGKIIYVRKLSTISHAAGAQQGQPAHIQQDFGPQATQFQSTSSANSLQAFQPISNASMSYPMLPMGPPLVPRKYTNGRVGDACTQFEQQIFNGMEMCQNTDTKLKTLMNSNAYKTVRSVNDIKELLIHMSYLLTFTLGRFKTLQDKCIDDLRQLGFTNEAESLSNGKVIRKYGSDSDVNEVEIVEPKHTTIDLDDSDDEQPKKAPDENSTAQPAADIPGMNSLPLVSDTGPGPVIQPPKSDSTPAKSTAENTQHKSNVVVIVLPQGILNDDVTSATTSRPITDVGDPRKKREEPSRNEKSDERIS